MPKKDKLSRPQKAFADKILMNPKITGVQAALETYDTENYQSAASIATRNLANPKIQAYLEEHSQVAEDTVMEIMSYAKAYAKSGGKDGAAYAAVAITAAKDVMDRLHGKATQKVETQSTSVNVNIDLTGMGESKELEE